jgi:nitrite reductase/ring-hydroxylating ferredoxin subunit/multimeric flavodoxin WrbA
MSDDGEWVDVGPAGELAAAPLQPVQVGARTIALTCVGGEFGAIDGRCNHVGGPLGEGTLDGDYVVCPWHHWKFHRRTGEGEPGFEEDRVPRYEVRVEDGRVLVSPKRITTRHRKPHDPHPLARPVEREAGPIRVVGISTTAMHAEHPRYSTSNSLLDTALEHAGTLGCETRLITLNDLRFRACEGYYSKSAHACTWPCSITQMDPEDEMDQVYEAFVHWGDAFVLSTPIRWGAASSLYYRMVERMNCIQNQETIADRHLLRDKSVGFIITGGQDNVQGVAGQLMSFFAEVGCQFPQFPYIAHTRGWSAEDMENNVRFVRESTQLRDGARGLVERTVAMARLMVDGRMESPGLVRGGRKAHRLTE